MLNEVQHQMEGKIFLKRFVDGHLTSPLLLVGPEGVGRRFSVLKAIQEFFCIGTRESNCTCPCCYAITNNSHPDVVSLSASVKDIGIDDIRGIVNEVKNYPSVAGVRCFIIDGADRFTVPAANAFLKVLEEPPSYVRFFLLSENFENVIPTIRSRCGKVRYRHLPEKFILSVVQQYVEGDLALVYTRMSEGSVGKALYYLNSGKLVLRNYALELLRLVAAKDIVSLFKSIDDLDQELLLILKFLEQLLTDIFFIHYLGFVEVHSDCVPALKALEVVPLSVWDKVAQKIRDLQHQYRTVKLNLSFHLKTILIEAFE